MSVRWAIRAAHVPGVNSRPAAARAATCRLQSSATSRNFPRLASVARGLPTRINCAARSAHSRLSAWPIAPEAPTTATVHSASAKPCLAQAASTLRIAVHVVRLLPLVIVSPGRCRSARPPSATIELKPPSPTTLAPRSLAKSTAFCTSVTAALPERARSSDGRCGSTISSPSATLLSVASIASSSSGNGLTNSAMRDRSPVNCSSLNGSSVESKRRRSPVARR